MDIFSIIVTAALYYFVFKLGENFAYFKIAKNIQNLKQFTDAIDSNRIEGVMEVEKIGEQYYAYVDNTFVGQGATVDEVKQLVRKFIEQHPDRYASMLVKMKE